MTCLSQLIAASLLASSPTLTQVTDIDGNMHKLGDRPTVIVFVKTTCPIANYYHPTLRRLADSWGDDVTLVMVHTEAARTIDELKKHQADYNVAGIVVHDHDGSITESLNAAVTPEAFVLDRAGLVKYRGRIDDTYLGFGRRRQVVTSLDLKNAVESVLVGQVVAIPTTKAIGCRIRKRDNESSK